MLSRRIQLTTQIEDFFRENRAGHRRLLALTYEFDPAAFERTFSSILGRAIQVDVVAGTECEGSTGYARFWRANWPGTFHPKLICLLADCQVCVGLGSANLTSSGMTENLEAWAWFNAPEDRPVLAGVRRFLQEMQDRRIFSKSILVEEFIKALPQSLLPTPVLNSLRATLLDQVVEQLPPRVRKVDIVTPINGDPSSIVLKLVAATGTREISLFTSEEPVSLVPGIKAYHTLGRPNKSDGEGLRAVSCVHAKLFAFYSKRSVDLFWGSANLSFSAWMARGKRANVEVLVHTRVTARQWLRLRNQMLPPGHSWEPCSPDRRARPEPLERPESGWRLLHATLQRGRLRLEASATRKVSIEIRAENARNTLRCPLIFKDAEAVLPLSFAIRLGCKEGRAPRWLLWRRPRTIKWRKIPVNCLDFMQDGAEVTDLAQQLFWEYCGRQLPRALGVSRPPPADDAGDKDKLSDDEQELTMSDRVGELDRFALEWRLIARRVAQTAGDNSALRRFHIDAVWARINVESRAAPDQWPVYRLDFVQRLLERKWLK